jgi:hypothetical protein
MPHLIALVIPERPLSYNASRDADRRAAYRSRLRAAWPRAGAVGGRIAPPCYGLAYHLHRQEVEGDADNISKPVWDALRGLAYDDDAAVLLRVAAKIRIDRGLPSGLVVGRIPPEALRRLTVLAGKPSHAHLLYIELGALAETMIPFGLGA